MQNNKIQINKINNVPDPLANIKKAKDSIFGFFFGSDLAVFITIIGIFVIISLGGLIGFEYVLPNIRTQFANNTVAIIAGIAFMILILKFAGSKVNLLDTPVDLGMLLYIVIIGGVVIAFSG